MRLSHTDVTGTVALLSRAARYCMRARETLPHCGQVYGDRSLTTNTVFLVQVQDVFSSTVRTLTFLAISFDWHDERRARALHTWDVYHLLKAAWVHTPHSCINIVPMLKFVMITNLSCAVSSPCTYLACLVSLFTEYLHLGLGNFVLQILDCRLEQFSVLVQQVASACKLFAQANEIAGGIVELP